MPSATTTAPRPAAPFQRTETPRYGGQNPGLNGGSFAQPRRFGFGSGLAAGLLGAGILGMLTGNGFFGGLGGVMSMFGFLLQIGLLVLAVRFALNYFRNRNGAAYAGNGSGPMPRPPMGGGLGGMGLGGLGGLGGHGKAEPPVREGVPVSQADFAAFERSLSNIQYAYGREDMTALGRMVTPEMLREFGEGLEVNRRRNLRNDLADVRLVQGDLSESWRENGSDYATLAMRFASRDTMVDRASGRVVEGDPNRPVESTELWTFRRDNGSAWRLSAIQQTT